MLIAGSLALGLAGLACTNDEGRDGTVTLTLEGLAGLEAQVPAGTVVSNNAMGIGVMLTGPGVSVTVGPALDVDARSLAAAKKNAESYAPTNVEEEALPDGYILTYESEGSSGPNYWLVGRRELTNAVYSCGVRSPKKAHQRSAIAICKSLKE
ncbi:MAG: hypothetical protein AB1Z98_32445 [Nannocystaceae bacterium]